VSALKGIRDSREERAAPQARRRGMADQAAWLVIWPFMSICATGTSTGVC